MHPLQTTIPFTHEQAFGLTGGQIHSQFVPVPSPQIFLHSALQTNPEEVDDMVVPEELDEEDDDMVVPEELDAQGIILSILFPK